ncbi:MAG: PAS domain-containing protein [Myxococcota bacterium]
MRDARAVPKDAALHSASLDPMPTELVSWSARGNVLEGVKVVSRQWVYLHVNDAAVRHGPRGSHSFVGRRLTDCHPGIESTELFAAMKRCMELRVPAALEHRCVVASGEERWFELRIEPVAEGICIHSVDIHQRKSVELALRRREEQLREMLASTVDGVVGRAMRASLGEQSQSWPSR